MGEIIGILSGLVTLTEVVVRGIKVAKTLYQAPEELSTLQAQLEHFEDLVKEIDGQHSSSTSANVTAALIRAKLTIEQLNQLIQVKILRNINGTNRARRRAWARNRSKIYQLRDALKEHRENILAAMSSNNLKSTNKAEATLNLISHDISHSREISLALDKRLSKIQQSLLDTHQAVLSQSHSVESMLHSVILYPQHRLESSGSQPLLSWHTSGGFFEPTINNLISRRGHSTQSGLLGEPYRISSSTNAQVYLGESPPPSPLLSRFSAIPRPASPFEMSPNFFPEIYTIDSLLGDSRIVIHSSYEETFAVNYRTNFYEVSFNKSPRQFSRINLSITFYRSSLYWNVLRKNPHSTRPFASRPQFIPQSLLLQLQKRLTELDTLEEGSCVEVSLKETCLSQNQERIDWIRILGPQNSVSKTNYGMISLLDDLRCPRYLENQVVPISFLADQRFASLVDGKLVAEIKSSQLELSPLTLYNIQALHCLKGASRVAEFFGIVVNSSRTHLRSYLREMPTQGNSFLNNNLLQIPWSRRENWARQLVEGLSQIHSRGFVAGYLFWRRPPIIIRGQDQLKFWAFRKEMAVNQVNPGYLPPELRHLRSHSSLQTRSSTANITPKIDIFQLGILLWYLGAAIMPSRDKGTFCKIAGCHAQNQSSCDEQHADPINLPPMAEDIPQYYKDIVTLCRAQDPDARPSAWRLLEMFPTQSTSQFQQISTSNNEHPNLDLIREQFDTRPFCDKCGEKPQGCFFHCRTCNEGDFDICSACFEIGLHCLDRDHFLMEINIMKNLWLPGSYYSSVRSSGKREILEL